MVHESLHLPILTSLEALLSCLNGRKGEWACITSRGCVRQYGSESYLHPRELYNNYTLSQLLPAELSLTVYVEYWLLLICCPQRSPAALWKKHQTFFQPLYQWQGWVPQQSSDFQAEVVIVGSKTKQSKTKQEVLESSWIKTHNKAAWQKCCWINATWSPS